MHKSCICILPVLLTVTCAIAQPGKFRFTQTKMGSPFHLILITDDSVKAVSIAGKAFQLVDSLNQVFSDYDTSSELSRLNDQAGTHPVKVSPALWDILLLSKKAYHASHGAFDITVAPLSTLWRTARKQHLFPNGDSIHTALQRIGFSKLSLNLRRHTIFIPGKGMRLDLGGIAKGYTAQLVAQFLQKNGIKKYLVDAGGDMVMGEAANETGGWLVGINIPETTDELLQDKLLLKNKAVATSGDVYQYIENNGQKYSHIIDPRTGYGITTRRNVTVIADTGATADWLATAASILPVEQSKELAVKLHASILITEIDQDGRILSYQTTDFARYWKTRSQ